MDKVMKAEIDKILDKVWGWASCGLEQPERDYKKDEFINQATSSLTALIIKWLDGKRGQQCLASGEYERNKMFGRNQLITELVEELK